MKLPAALLVGSLAVNLAFAALFVWRPDATRTFLREAFGLGHESRPEVVPAPAKTTPAAARVLSDRDASSAAIDWAHLQASDFPALPARLTALGFPPGVARTVTAVLIMKYYDQRRRAVHPQGDPADYWRNLQGGPPSAAELAAYQAIDREQQKAMRDTVGLDFEFDDDGSRQRRQFGNLSGEKIASLKKIFADYSDLEEQLYADGADRNSPETRARSALLAQEKRADIERLLTAEELLDYDLRNSTGSHRLRGKFGAFQPTEEEFRALYPAFATADDSQSQPNPISGANAAEQRRKREAAERELEAGMRRVLGDERFAQWQEANDQSLHETRTLVANLNLPPATVSDIVAIQKEIQPKLAAIERDRDLSANQRDAQLAALGADARDRLIQVLGAPGFEAYKRRGGGWLGAALSRNVPTPPP